VKIIRGELTDQAVIPPSTRYDSTCNCIQVTTDGGSTWVEAVGQDPRSQPAYLKPPVSGSNKQCDAAANMTAYIKAIIDSFIAALDAGATDLLLVNDLVQFIEALFPFAAYFIQLMFELAVDVLATGATDLATAFDSATYDQLTCIFYCHADVNGMVSDGALGAIESDIAAQLNTTAALILAEILLITGSVGLSNAGATGSETGDCSGCACAWTYTWDFTISDGGWTFVDYGGDAGGTWVSGAGFQAVANGGNSYGSIFETCRTSPSFDLPGGSTITQICLEMSNDLNSDGAHEEYWTGTTRGDGLSHTPVQYTNHALAASCQDGSRAGSISGMNASFTVYWIGAAYDVRKMTITGTGDHPGFTGGSFS